MRIFYASHDQGNSNPASRTWYNNLYLPLCEIADEVVRFDFDLFPFALNQDFHIERNKAFLHANRNILEKELIRQIKQQHKIKPIDIFFSYFSSSYCSNKVIEQIKEMGIITVNWFCNASYQFHLIKEIAPAYNYCLVPEKFRLEDYKHIGAKPLYCQEAANPYIYKPHFTDRDIDVSFVGTRYADRANMLFSLNYENVQVKVWGENWVSQHISKKGSINKIKEISRNILNTYRKLKPIPESHTGAFISDEAMVKVFSRSKINLGFSKCWNSEIDNNPIKQVRLRDFEIPMSGGFYIAEENKELEDFFAPDKEVVYFSSRKELVEKVKYYLHHPNEREKIRLNGYNRAINDHSWQKRLKDQFTLMGF